MKMSRNVTPLKKVTAANVFGSVLTHLQTLSADENGEFTKLKKGAQVELFDIIGRIDGIKTGTSQFGDWTMFTGQFEAVNLVTGEVFMGPSAALPEPIQSMLVNALAEHDSVDLGGRIVARVNRPELNTETAYEYLFKPITEVKPAQALDHLRLAREAFSNDRALPAPSAEDTAPAKKGSKK